MERDQWIIKINKECCIFAETANESDAIDMAGPLIRIKQKSVGWEFDKWDIWQFFVWSRWLGKNL